jgi:predicted ArsR family transcriptional regulator
MSIFSQLALVADPVRLQILRRLSEGGPASVTELAAAADVHVNTARPHVAALEEARVLVRTAGEPAGRGRPADRYALAEDWRLPGDDLHGLAELLAGLLVRVAPGREEIESFGRDWGRFLLGRPGGHDLHRDLPPALERLGFQARMDGDEVQLSSCPCPLVSPQRPDLLCSLAVAVIDGLADAAGSPLRVGAAAHDSRRRRCSAGLQAATVGQRARGRPRGSAPRAEP